VFEFDDRVKTLNLQGGVGWCYLYTNIDYEANGSKLTTCTKKVAIVTAYSGCIKTEMCGEKADLFDYPPPVTYNCPAGRKEAPDPKAQEIFSTENIAIFSACVAGIIILLCITCCLVSRWLCPKPTLVYNKDKIEVEEYKPKSTKIRVNKKTKEMKYANKVKKW